MIYETQKLIAAATAHRACCGVEQDLPNGKIHGYCVVCGVPWPCETAAFFIFNASKTTPNTRFGAIAAWLKSQWQRLRKARDVVRHNTKEKKK